MMEMTTMGAKLQGKRILPIVILAAAAAVGGSLPGCGGCGGGKAPLGLVPRDALVVVVVPGISDALTGAKALFDRFKGNPLVAAGVQQKKAQVVRELGFDPEKPESLKKIGVDPSKGFVGFLAGDGKSGAIAFGVSDAEALEKYMITTARRAAGAEVSFKEKTTDGIKVKEVAIKGSSRALGAYAIVKGKTFVFCNEARDNKHAEYLAGLVKQSGDIGDNKVFSRLSKKVGKHQVLVYVSGDGARKASKAEAEARLKGASKYMEKYIKEQQETQEALLAHFDGAAAGLVLSGKRAALTGYVAVPEAQAKKLAGLFKGKGDAPEFGKFIGPDALMFNRITLNAKMVKDKALESISPREKRRIYQRMKRLEERGKINVEKVIDELLAGRYAMAMYPPNIDLQGGLRSLMSADALTAISMVFFVQVTDEGKAATLLSSLEKMMVMGRQDVRIQSKGDLKLYYLEVGGKKVVGWAVKDGVVVVATGDRLEPTLALMEKGGENVLGHIDNSRAKGLLKSDDGNVAYYNLQKSADAARGLKLPAEVKLMISPVLSLFNSLADLTGALEVKDAGVLGELTLKLTDQ